MNNYQQDFAKWQPDCDPRHIEAFVRLERGTLSNLPIGTLKREARIAAECIKVGGKDAAEGLAQSFGL